MIDRAATIEKFGYDPDELKPKSSKRVVAVCEGCGVIRDIYKKLYRDLCHSCANRTKERRKKISEARKGKPLSEEHRKKLSVAHKGKKHSKETRENMSEAQKGRVFTEEHRKKISEAQKGGTRSAEARKNMSDAASNRSVEARKNMSEAQKGKTLSKEHKEKMSATHQGISYEEWEAFAANSPYCPAFDEACRESNREKYGRRCFICDLHESKNIDRNGKVRKLSVHHVDMRKDQGCDGHEWKLVPTCLHHHATTHTPLWIGRITYLLRVGA